MGRQHGRRRTAGLYSGELSPRAGRADAPVERWVEWLTGGSRPESCGEDAADVRDERAAADGRTGETASAGRRRIDRADPAALRSVPCPTGRAEWAVVVSALPVLVAFAAAAVVGDGLPDTPLVSQRAAS